MKNVIGIDLGGTTIKGGLIQNGQLILKELLPVKKKGNSGQIINDICTLIGSLMEGDLAGIGFAVPALIDQQKGTIFGLSNIPQLNDVPIKQILEDKFQMPVFLQNDANCFVLGEQRFGLAKNYNDVIGLITGTGVGAGIIIDGKLYNGSNFGAGEFGMIPYRDRNFEAYCGGNFFTSFYGISGEETFFRVASGDKVALEAFQVYGSHLGELLKLICYAFDPQIIILGGSVSKSFRYFEQALQKSMESFYFSSGIPAIIKPSELEDIAIFGAAGLCFDNNVD